MPASLLIASSVQLLPAPPPCPQAAHVPYRDSVVTQLLADVLGGEAPCLTQMLCCLSPSSSHWHETKCTLEYARRTARLEEEEPDDWHAGEDADGDVSSEHKAIAAASPMVGDEFDEVRTQTQPGDALPADPRACAACGCPVHTHQGLCTCLWLAPARRLQPTA